MGPLKRDECVFEAVSHFNISILYIPTPFKARYLGGEQTAVKVVAANEALNLRDKLKAVKSFQKGKSINEAQVHGFRSFKN